MSANKFFAQCFFMVCSLALALGNYWYTFGLWPKSWLAFFGFGAAGILMLIIRLATDDKK